MLMLLSVHVTSVLFLVRFNNFALTVGFYWSYALLLQSPVLMRSCRQRRAMHTCIARVRCEVCTICQDSLRPRVVFSILKVPYDEAFNLMTSQFCTNVTCQLVMCNSSMQARCNYKCIAVGRYTMYVNCVAIGGGECTESNFIHNQHGLKVYIVQVGKSQRKSHSSKDAQSS